MKVGLTIIFVIGSGRGKLTTTFVVVLFSNCNCFEICFIYNCMLGSGKYFRDIIDLIDHAAAKL